MLSPLAVCPSMPNQSEHVSAASSGASARLDVSKEPSDRSMTEAAVVQRAPPSSAHVTAARSSARADGCWSLPYGASSLANPQKLTPVYHVSMAPAMGSMLMRAKTARATMRRYCTGQKVWYSSVTLPEVERACVNAEPISRATSADAAKEARRSPRRSWPNASATTPPV